MSVSTVGKVIEMKYRCEIKRIIINDELMCYFSSALICILTCVGRSQRSIGRSLWRCSREMNGEMLNEETSSFCLLLHWTFSRDWIFHIRWCFEWVSSSHPQNSLRHTVVEYSLVVVVADCESSIESRDSLWSVGVLCRRRQMLSSVLDDEVSLFGRRRSSVRREHSPSSWNIRQVPAPISRLLRHFQSESGSWELPTEFCLSFDEWHDRYWI